MKLLFTIMFLLSFNSFSYDWEFVRDFEGVKLYKNKTELDGLLPFKAEYESNYDIEEFVKLLLDYQQKKTWAPKLKDVKMHERKGDTFIFSEYYKTPWPFYDREFLLEGRFVRDGNVAIFAGKDYYESQLVNSSHVKATVDLLDVKLTKTKNGTKIEFSFIGDMGGIIPKWVSNIIQQRWPVRFIQAMEKKIKNRETRETKEYLEFKIKIHSS